MLKVVCESAHMKIFTNILFSCFSSTQILCRYDQLSDGLEDVFVDKKMNTQITLEDEDALDPIDDIWRVENENFKLNMSARKMRHYEAI